MRKRIAIYFMLSLVVLGLQGCSFTRTAIPTPSPSVTVTPVLSPTPAPEGSVYDQRWRHNQEYNYESLAAAEDAFREALEREPDNAAIYVSQAIMYLRVFRFEEAEESLKRAEELDPENPQLYVALGWLHLSCLRLEEGRQSFEKALELDPNNIDANFGVADYYHRQNNYSSEFEVHDHIIEIATGEDLLEAHYWRANLHNSLDNYSEALAEFDLILSIDPNYAPAVLGKGVAYSRQGDDVKAQEYYEQGLALDPTDPFAYTCMASLLRRHGRTAEGIEYLDQALELAPFDVEVYDQRAWFFAREGDYARAAEEINQAVELSPYLHGALFDRGLFYGYAGQYQEAIDSYTQVIELRPDSHTAYINRAYNYYKLEEWDAALADLDKALALGEIPQAYYNKGLVLYKLGEVEEALQYFDYAISLHSGSTDYHIDRSVAHFDLGHLEEAIADIQTATDMNTSLEKIRGNDWFDPHHNYFIQGVGLDHAGYPDEAIEAYQNFLQVYNIEDEFRAYVQERLTELGG